MRDQNHSILPVLQHHSRLTNSIVSSRKRRRSNAQKAGVFAEPLILPGEDPHEFEALHSALIEEWDPSGPSEQSRVFGIADAEWRKLRARRFVQAKAIANSVTPEHPALMKAAVCSLLATSCAVNQKLLSPNTRAASYAPIKSTI